VVGRTVLTLDVECTITVPPNWCASNAYECIAFGTQGSRDSKRNRIKIDFSTKKRKKMYFVVFYKKLLIIVFSIRVLMFWVSLIIYYYYLFNSKK